MVILDLNYKQPEEWKYALGGTWRIPWQDIQMDFDYLHTEQFDSAIYVDLSQTVVGMTATVHPIYALTNGSDNYMLTNSPRDGSSDLLSASFRKKYDYGLALMFG